MAITDAKLIPDAVQYDGKSISAEAYLAMVRTFHGTFVDNLDTDFTSKYLKEEIGKQSRVSLIGINEARKFAQKRVDLDYVAAASEG